MVTSSLHPLNLSGEICATPCGKRSPSPSLSLPPFPSNAHVSGWPLGHFGCRQDIPLSSEMVIRQHTNMATASAYVSVPVSFPASASSASPPTLCLRLIEKRCLIEQDKRCGIYMRIANGNRLDFYSIYMPPEMAHCNSRQYSLCVLFRGNG